MHRGLENACRAVANRQRSQNLVEFGLGVAAIAFVALLGFGALGQAQAAYWGAASTTFDTPPPQSTNSFLHPTQVDAPQCSPQPAKLGLAFTCSSPTVHDVYSDPSLRTPPGGSIGLFVNGVGPRASCLVSASGAAMSSCPNLIWTPNDSTLLWATVPVTLEYYAMTTNHQPNTSPTLTVTFVPNLQWSFPSASNPPCVDPLTSTPTLQVSLGHPLLCTVAVVDASNPTSPVSFQGAPLTWSTVNGGGPPNDGVGIFTCATNLLADMFNAGKCPSPGNPIPKAGQATTTCSTDASGNCTIVYRRMFDANSKGVGSQPALTISSPLLSGTASVTLNPIVAPSTLNPSGMYVSCIDKDPLSPHLTVQPVSPDPTFGNAQFKATNTMQITGAPYVTAVQCTALVFDANPTGNPSVVSSGSPNQQQAFPPAGNVTFSWATSSTSVTIATCQLTRIDYSAAFPQQAIGQAPFMSSCQTPTLTLSGSPGQTSRLDVDYAGEGGASRAHSASPQQSVHVDFFPSS